MRLVLTVTLLAGFALPAYSKDPLTEKPLSLDELLIDYRYFGLPLPPEGAPLVRYVRDHDTPPKYSVAFQLRPKGKDISSLMVHKALLSFLSGLDIQAVAISDDPENLKGIEITPWTAAELAIQCHATGRNKLALHLFAIAQREPQLLTRRHWIKEAWSYWEYELRYGKTDWATVTKYLRILVSLDEGEGIKWHRRLLRALELSLLPPHSKPGSVEALIDDLVNSHSEYYPLDLEEWDAPSVRVIERGFDAVPALIEHLNDDRLTHIVDEGLPTFPTSSNHQVRHVVTNLLESIAGERIGRTELDRWRGKPVSPKAARAWFARAQKIGEERYCVDRLFPKDHRAGKPDGTMLHIIATKYPNRLPDMFRAALAQPDGCDMDLFVRELFDAKLPMRQKLETFASASGNNLFRHSDFADLMRSDRNQVEDRLLELLEFSKDYGEAYYGLCPERAVFYLAAARNSQKTWEALTRASKQCSLGFRMEMIEQVGKVAMESEDVVLRRKCLNWLSQFLTDAALRDSSESRFYRGPFAGHAYDRLEVRDIAAMELAANLKIPVEIKPDRTAAQWAELRAKVRAAYEKGIASPPK